MGRSRQEALPSGSTANAIKLRRAELSGHAALHPCHHLHRRPRQPLGRPLLPQPRPVRQVPDGDCRRGADHHRVLCRARAAQGGWVGPWPPGGGGGGGSGRGTASQGSEGRTCWHRRALLSHPAAIAAPACLLHALWLVQPSHRPVLAVQVTLSYDLEPGTGAVVQKGLHKVVTAGWGWGWALEQWCTHWVGGQELQTAALSRVLGSSRRQGLAASAEPHAVPPSCPGGAVL